VLENFERHLRAAALERRLLDGPKERPADPLAAVGVEDAEIVEIDDRPRREG
jgi:hypothetical protein